MGIGRSAVLFVLASATVASAAQPGPDGERVYRQYCARCHEGTLPRMPTRDMLLERTPEDVEIALSTFTMRRQGAPLSSAERRAVAEYVTGRPPGSYRAPLDVIADSAYCTDGAGTGDPLGGPAWNGWGAGLRNARFQPAEVAGLTPDEVPRLALKWAFGFPGVSAAGSQATIIGGRVFVGSRNGMVYALDADSGCIDWTVEADGGVRSAPSVGQHPGTTDAVVYFGDAFANVYAVDVDTGSMLWKVKVDDHGDAMITGAPALHDGRLYVPVSSLEEGSGSLPTYECCTFIGSVVALDAADGRQIWKRHTILEAPQRTTRNSNGTQLWGPSGAAIWSAPTLDPDRNRLYVATGDSYSAPAAPESDAIMAMAMDTGRVLWTRQTLPGDAWIIGCLDPTPEGRVNCPEDAGPDHDFGSSPVLTTIADGREVLLAGQKSGVLYGLDPQNGEIVWETRVGDGGVLGGIEWGFATDGELTYAASSEALEKAPGDAGGLTAVRVADGQTLWDAPPFQDTCGSRVGCTTGQPAAVTSIPGVVFSGSLDGHLRAYDTTSGRVIWDVDTVGDLDTINGVPARGGSINGPGPTVAGGMLFVTSGYGALGFMPGNVLLAFSVDGQ